MTLRHPAAIAVLTVLGLAAENTAVAQPIAPPRRPTYSSYGSLFGPGLGGYYGYGAGGGGYGFGYGFGGPAFGGFGFGGPGFGFGNGVGFANRFGGMQQNMMMMQQMNVMNQNLANLQTFIATGVNPNFPITGRGAVFNNLGHWYPAATTGGMMGGGMMGGGMMGMYGGRTAGSGFPLGGGIGGPAGGANTARTAGSGIGIPPSK
jgi:heterogeneous nuclear ribonucleoprotein A1/A3